MYIILIDINIVKDDEIARAPAAYIFTKPKTIWPALILAAKRKDRVIGRTRILMDSIKTNGGASQVGAPDGNNLAQNWDGELNNEDITILIHKGKPKVKVSNRWEVVPKIYGIKPSKFIIIKKMNKGAIIWGNPFKIALLLRDNWEPIKDMGINNIDVILLFNIHEGDNKNNKKIGINNQKINELHENKILVAGSKLEKISTSMQELAELF